MVKRSGRLAGMTSMAIRDHLGELIRDHYVFPDVAEQIGDRSLPLSDLDPIAVLEVAIWC